MGKKALGPILLLAIERNDSDKVREILTTQVRSPDKIRQICTSAICRPPSEVVDVPLFAAAALDDPALVTYLVETHGVDVNYVRRTGDAGVAGCGRLKVRSALLAAVRHGCHVTASVLVSLGADAGLVDHKRRSLLHHAVRRADYSMAKLLLTQGGARVDVADAADNTPLHVAAIFGHVQLARLLLCEDSGVACLSRPAQHGALPIHMAATQGHVDMLALFCMEGGGVEMAAACYDGRQKAALHVAAEHGHVEAVVALVERHGASVNLHDSEGETPLHCTVLHAHDPLGMRSRGDFTRTAHALLRAGAAVDALNKRGETALHLAARSEAHTMLTLLLQAGCDPLLEDNDHNKAVDLVSPRDLLVVQALRTAMVERERRVGEALEVRARGFSTATTPGQSASSLGAALAPLASVENGSLDGRQGALVGMYAEDGYLQPLGSRSNISQVAADATGKDVLLTKSPRKRRSRENLLRLRASKQNGHSSDSSQCDELRPHAKATKPAEPRLISRLAPSQAHDRRRLSSDDSSMWVVSPRNSTAEEPTEQPSAASSPARAPSTGVPPTGTPVNGLPNSVATERKGPPVISIEAAGVNRSSEALAHAFSDSDDDNTSFIDDASFITVSDNEADNVKLRGPKPLKAGATGAPLQGWLSQQAGLLKELKQHQAAGPVAHSTPPAHRVGQRPEDGPVAMTDSDRDASPEPPSLPPRKPPDRPLRKETAVEVPQQAGTGAHGRNHMLNKSSEAVQEITVELSDGAIPSQTVITVVNKPGMLAPPDRTDGGAEKRAPPQVSPKPNHVGKPPPPTLPVETTPMKRRPERNVDQRPAAGALHWERASVGSSVAGEWEAGGGVQGAREQPTGSMSGSEAVYAEIESEPASTAAELSSDDDDDEEVPNSGHQVAMLYDMRGDDESDNLVMSLYHQRAPAEASSMVQCSDPPVAHQVAAPQPAQLTNKRSLSSDCLSGEAACQTGEGGAGVTPDVTPPEDDPQQRRRVTYGVEEIIPNNVTRPKDADHRRVNYDGAGRVRIAVIGGNADGVYVHRIDPGCDAERRGLLEGDELLAIGADSVKGWTREDVTLALMSLKHEVSLLVRQRRDRYEHVLDGGGGDAFFVRARFAHDASTRDGELTVRDGDIFSVRETLPGGQMGSWRAVRLAAAPGSTGQDEQEGLIPNRPRAEQLVLTQRLAKQQAESREATSPGSFLRRSFRRSKSLDRLNKISRSGRGSASEPPTPEEEGAGAYERIEQQSVAFHRPIVLLGLFSDAVLDRLLRDSPEVFGAPGGELEKPTMRPNAAPVDVALINAVTATKKHCLAMLSPRAITFLAATDLHPIVIYLAPGGKAVLKAVRTALAPNFGRRINHLLEEANAFERAHCALFTATVNYTADDGWFSLLKDTINRIQNQPLWQTLPDDDAKSAAFVFPMAEARPKQDTRLRLNRSTDDILGQTDQGAAARGGSGAPRRDTGRSRPAKRGAAPTSQQRVDADEAANGKPKSILKKNSLDRNGNNVQRGANADNSSTSSSSSSLPLQASRVINADITGRPGGWPGAAQRPGARQTGRQGVRPIRNLATVSHLTGLSSGGI